MMAKCSASVPKPVGLIFDGVAVTGGFRRPGSVEEIEASPRGRKVGAYFDLDGTLIAGYSAKFLAQERLRSRDLSGGELLRTFGVLLAGGVNQDSFAELLEIGAEGWRGRSHDDLESMGQRLFDKHVARTDLPGDEAARCGPPEARAHGGPQLVGLQLPGRAGSSLPRHRPCPVQPHDPRR